MFDIVYTDRKILRDGSGGRNLEIAIKNRYIMQGRHSTNIRLMIAIKST